MCGTGQTRRKVTGNLSAGLSKAPGISRDSRWGLLFALDETVSRPLKSARREPDRREDLARRDPGQKNGERWGSSGSNPSVRLERLPEGARAAFVLPTLRVPDSEIASILGISEALEIAGTKPDQAAGASDGGSRRATSKNAWDAGRARSTPPEVQIDAHCGACSAAGTME